MIVGILHSHSALSHPANNAPAICVMELDEYDVDATELLETYGS